MKVYLAGPMTGIPEFNFPLFFEVANALREQGWWVFNPAEHDLETCPALKLEPGYAEGIVAGAKSFDARCAFLWDFARILEADAIVLLPGWEASTGARAERLVAEKTGKLCLIATRDGSGERPKDDGWVVKADENQARMSVEAMAAPAAPAAPAEPPIWLYTSSYCGRGSCLGMGEYRRPGGYLACWKHKALIPVGDPNDTGRSVK